MPVVANQFKTWVEQVVTREGGSPVVEKDPGGGGGGRRVYRGLFHKMNAAQKEALKGYELLIKVRTYYLFFHSPFHCSLSTGAI